MVRGVGARCEMGFVRARIDRHALAGRRDDPHDVGVARVARFDGRARRHGERGAHRHCGNSFFIVPRIVSAGLSECPSALNAEMTRP